MKDGKLVAHVQCLHEKILIIFCVSDDLFAREKSVHRGPYCHLDVLS